MYADSQHIYAEYLVLQALLFRDQCYFHYASQASDSLKIVGKKATTAEQHQPLEKLLPQLQVNYCE